MDLGVVPGLLAAHPFAAVPLVFVGGVLTSLTPCIYPMIPITAAVIGGQSGANVARGRVVALTAAYVSGLATVYAALGLFAGLTGSLFGSVGSSPWLQLLVANLLIGLALMLLDVLPVPVPRGWAAWAGGLEPGGRVLGTFGVGAASGLVAAPCGAPVLAAVLTWVASSKSGALGFVYLFCFSLGMCALLVVVGLASGGVVRLPRAGRWTLWVKRGFALLLLAVSEYYLMQAGFLLL
jgi:thiol:disulfide interchange protein DsbD